MIKDEFVCRACYDRMSAYSIIHLVGSVWNIVDDRLCTMVLWHPEFKKKKKELKKNE